MRQSLARAFTYPCLVLTVMIVLTLGLCFSIIPRFQSLFASFHAPLPFVTRVLFASVDFLQSHFLLLLIAFGIFGWGGIKFWRNHLRHACLRAGWTFQIPIAGRFYQSVLLARFFKVLGIAIQAGLSLQESLSLLHNLFEGSPFAAALNVMKYELKQGRSLEEIFDQQFYFPEVCIGFIKVAAETGQLETQFLNLAHLFEEALATQLERYKILLEPLALLITGVIVGGMVLAIYYPIFTLGGII